MAKIKTKKITIDDLKVKIDDIAVAVSDGFKEVAEGFKKQEKLTDEKIDNLAAMTKRGFDKTAKKEDSDIVKQELVFLKSDVEDIKEKVENIEKLILQQHSFQIKELENKVRYIEEVLTIVK